MSQLRVTVASSLKSLLVRQARQTRQQEESQSDTPVDPPDQSETPVDPPDQSETGESLFVYDCCK